MNKHGFSLLECCVVIAILMLLGALGMHMGAVQGRSVLRFELEKLYGIIVYAQRKAMLTGQEQKIIFDEQKRCYIVNEKIHTLYAGISYGYTSHMRGPPAHPVSQISKCVTFKDNTLYCYPDGTVSAGTVYLAEGRSRKHVALTCGVSPLVYVRFYSYDTKRNNWQLINHHAE